MHLDKKDKKILAILDMDARMPVTQIAKKVGLSREVVDYRIKQLEKNKIIDGYYVAIDITKLGLLYCRLFFRYRKMSQKKEQELLDYCNKHPHLTWLIYGEGMFDVAITIVGMNLEIIYTVYDELLEHFGAYLQHPYLTFAYKIYHYPHNYLYDTLERKELILGQHYSSPVLLDDIDYKLIDALSIYPTMSLISLAQKIKLTAKIVLYRLKKLQHQKIILGFRTKINTRLLGYDRYKVFLTLEKIDKKKLQNLHEYLVQHPHVIYITKPMGMHNLEFEIMVKNANYLHEIMSELKEKFGEIVVNYQTNLYYSEPILSYVPLQKQLQH